MPESGPLLRPLSLLLGRLTSVFLPRYNYRREKLAPYVTKAPQYARSRQTPRFPSENANVLDLGHLMPSHSIKQNSGAPSSLGRRGKAYWGYAWARGGMVVYTEGYVICSRDVHGHEGGANGGVPTSVRARTKSFYDVDMPCRPIIRDGGHVPILLRAQQQSFANDAVSSMVYGISVRWALK